MPVDLSDPCAVAEALRAVYHARMLGEQAQKIRFRASTGEEREVENATTNLAELRIALRQAEADCASKQGKAPRRFAIR